MRLLCVFVDWWVVLQLCFLDFFLLSVLMLLFSIPPVYFGCL